MLFSEFRGTKKTVIFHYTNLINFRGVVEIEIPQKLIFK
jgi:hypothetical protein